MKKFLSVASLVAAFGFVATVPAQADLKVGIVDMNKIFSSYSKTKEAEKKLNEARAEAKKELEERVQGYKKNLEEVNKLNEELKRPELSNEAKEKKAKERDEKIAQLQSLERELNQFRAERDKNFQEQAVRMRDGIVKEILAVVNERVKKDQYDLVFDKSGLSMNGVPVLIYSKDANDFSQDVIETLNKAAGSSSASSPAATTTPSKKK